ncbi:hypothetical protein JOE40_001505 [Arthrobacter sp. PvP102]|uniref:hypothetical protein n=1 Tax=unclassified Arthrobacter TaxID=235627 RepID=UPI001AE3557E|nr:MULTISPECIES: hypothetical protein [unclassified Arthrobacter]MBP1231861.1 hypothetical protein [Arthrobacter sp. PvP103]MBP1236996.1 hypothetical protein [Arthrobacter sp. PvP102]
MTRKAGARRARLGAAFIVAAVVMSGCSGEGKGEPAWTAGVSPTESPTTAGTSPASSPVATPGAGDTGAQPSSTGTESASAGATAAAWKVFSDSTKNVSFELPQDWIAQSVTPDQGTLPGAIKIEVKDARGGYLATLQTGLPSPSAAACQEAARKPYVVVSSVPVDLPHREGDGLIAPHVVFRVIQGYRYFGSYGITNVVGGSDGRACALQNIVRGPEGKGDVSFGDLAALKALATDEKVAPAKAFDTLDQAAKYVNEGSEFANVQRMLMSLKIKS